MGDLLYFSNNLNGEGWGWLKGGGGGGVKRVASRCSKVVVLLIFSKILHWQAGDKCIA